MKLFLAQLKSPKILLIFAVLLLLGLILVGVNGSSDELEIYSPESVETKSSRSPIGILSNTTRSNDVVNVRNELDKLIDSSLKKELARLERARRISQKDLKRRAAGHSRDREVLAALLSDLGENDLEDILIFWKKACIDSKYLELIGYESITTYSQLSEFEAFLTDHEFTLEQNSEEDISNYFAGLGESVFLDKYPELGLLEKRSDFQAPLESREFMELIIGRYPEKDTVLLNLRDSALKIFSEKQAYQKLHKCTYSAALSDEQRQDLLEAFLSEPDLEPEEALERLTVN